MSRIPDQIENVGKTSQRCRRNPEFDPTEHPFDRDSYFVWSRIDGVTTLRDVIAMVGLPPPRTVAILRDLRMRGAILAPGEVPASVADRIAAARAAAPPSPPSPSPPSPSPVSPGQTRSQASGEAGEQTGEQAFEQTGEQTRSCVQASARAYNQPRFTRRRGGYRHGRRGRYFR